MTRTPSEIADSIDPPADADAAELREWKLGLDPFKLRDAAAMLRTLTPSPDHRAAAEEIDAIMTDIYRQFKDWSKRKFSADDVTWCVVRAAVLGIIARRFPASPQPALAKEFDALAEKATQGPMRSMREGNQYLDGLHSADGKSLVGASRVDGLARPWNRGGAALFIDMEHVSRFRDADADFIAWCFNHRTEISRALGGAMGDASIVDGKRPKPSPPTVKG